MPRPAIWGCCALKCTNFQSICLAVDQGRRLRREAALLGLLSLLLTNGSALSADPSGFAASTDPGYLRLDAGPLGFASGDQTRENSFYKLGAKFNAMDEAQPKSGALQGFSMPRKNW